MKPFGQLLQKIATISNFQDGSLFPNAIFWDIVWVNLDIVVNVSTNFLPVINFQPVINFLLVIT